MARLKIPAIYSLELSASIAKLRTQGKTLTWICKQRGYPSLDQHYLWISKHPEYKELMIESRKEYAASIYERAVSIADTAANLTDTRLLPALRLSFDALCYGARMASPSEYSPTNQIITEAKPVESYADVLERINDDHNKRTPSPEPTPAIAIPGPDTEQ